MKACVAFPITVLALCAFASASASEYPARKPGLWEMTMKGPNFPGGVMRSNLCIDAASEIENNVTTESYMKSNCSRFDTRKEGNTWIVDSVCTFSGIHTASHQVTTMKGEDAYHTDGTSTRDAPKHGEKSDVLTVDSKWLGACKPGQKPGVPEMGR